MGKSIGGYMKYHIIGHGGLGDELCFTPVYRVLKRDGHYVQIAGKQAAGIAINSPYVDSVINVGDKESDVDRTIDMKWHNEVNYGYGMHLCEFYADQAGVSIDSNELDFILTDDERAGSMWVNELNRPIVAYNSYGGWDTKAFNLAPVAKMLEDKGITMMQIGNAPRYAGIGYNMVGYIDSLREMGAILQRCDLYLGNDNGIFHLASAVGCHSVTVFTSTDPLCYIHNADTDSYICSDVCHGCYNNKSNKDIVRNVCPRSDYTCCKLDYSDIVKNVMRRF